MKQKIAWGFEPGAAKRLEAERRFYEEVSPTLRQNAGDNQASAVIAYETDNDDREKIL